MLDVNRGIYFFLHYLSVIGESAEHHSEKGRGDTAEKNLSQRKSKAGI